MRITTGLWSLGVLTLAAACLILACCQSGSAYRQRTGGETEVAMVETSVLNGRLFADQRQSSFLPVAARIEGTEVWSVNIPDITGRAPLCLGLHGQDLIVSYGNLIAVQDKSDGTTRWTQSIRGNHLFALEESGIVTLDQTGNLVPLGYDDQPAEKVFLAWVDRGMFLHLLAQQGDEFAYCLEERPRQLSKPTDNPAPAVSRFIRYRPDKAKILWQYKMPIHLRSVAMSPDLKQTFVATVDKFFAFPSDATSEEQVTSLEWPNLVSLSVTADGAALVVDTNEGRTNLSSVQSDGKTAWSISFDKTDVSPQPPASTPDGYVYLVIDSTLHQMRNGELLWSHRLKAKTQDIAITVLADNSVLAAAGQALVHVSATGEELLTKWLDAPVVTRPIMDENGRVYYGGVDGIHCMR